MTLILSTRNLCNQSGARNLILKRAIAQNHLYDDEQVLISFSKNCNKDALEVFAKKGIFSIPVEVNKNSFFSLIYGYIKLFKKVYSRNYGRIILTGYFPVIFILLLKIFCRRSKFLYDIHGAVEEKIEYPQTFFLLEYFKYFVLKANSILIYNFISDHIVVSSSLMEYVKKFRVFKKSCKFYIIPCTDLDLKNNILVNNTPKLPFKFIYTGSDAPWQCLNETLSLFKEISKNFPSELVLLISNPNYSIPKEFIDLPISKFSVPAEEVSDYLEKSDFAFLIRKSDITNKVAYPNKFYDYISHGLPVITTNAIDDIYFAVNKFSLGAVIDLENFLPESIISSCLSSLTENNFKKYIRLVSFQNTLESLYSEK